LGYSKSVSSLQVSATREQLASRAQKLIRSMKFLVARERSYDVSQVTKNKDNKTKKSTKNKALSNQ
jgi:hypothetical protein